MKIIAYGSLMNKKSLAKTLKEPIKLTKITIKNFERVFNAPFGKFAYLNLRPRKNAKIEAAYFEASNKQINLLNKREGIAPTEIQKGFFAYIWPKEKCANLPVVASYIKVCETGAKELDINFWQGTVVPKKIINDLKNPLYENYAE
jgi:gamma-glutamylcyclotransferase (GGCT)/AIG2-like uncharacterized protein YtfP